MVAKHIIVSILVICPFLLFAQASSSSDSTTHQSTLSPRRQRALAKRERINKLIEQEDEGALVFNKQWAIGLKLNTDGYSFYYEHGKYKTIKRTNLWWLEIGEKKQHNQQKVTPEPTVTNYPGYSIVSVGNNYVYGKENNFYPVKLGFGRQILIGGKGTSNGVAVSATYGGGLTLGLVKPYYVQVLDSTSQTEIADIKYDDNPIEFLDPTLIVGSSGFSKGLDKMTVVPGLHARGSIRFDYGRFRETLSALEVGFNADYYAKKVTIMAQNPNHNLFLNVYLAFVFGGRK